MDYIKLNRDVIVDGVILSKDLVIETYTIKDCYVTRLGKVEKECADVVHPFYFIVNNKHYCAVMAVDEEEAHRIVYNTVGHNTMVCYDEDSWNVKKGSPLWNAALYCGKINPLDKSDSIEYHFLQGLTRIPLDQVKQYL